MFFPKWRCILTWLMPVENSKKTATQARIAKPAFTLTSLIDCTIAAVVKSSVQTNQVDNHSPSQEHFVSSYFGLKCRNIEWVLQTISLQTAKNFIKS